MMSSADHTEKVRPLELIDRCQRTAAECAHAGQLLALAVQHMLRQTLSQSRARRSLNPGACLRSISGRTFSGSEGKG
jgi:hypothetical protein